MSRKQRKQYEAPRVKVTYPKGRLEAVVQPHGGPRAYVIIIDD